MGKRMGRPAIDNPKGTQIAVRLDSEDLGCLEENATRYSETRAESIRRGIRELHRRIMEGEAPVVASSGNNSKSAPASNANTDAGTEQLQELDAAVRFYGLSAEDLRKCAKLKESLRRSGRTLDDCMIE